MSRQEMAIAPLQIPLIQSQGTASQRRMEMQTRYSSLKNIYFEH